jgi:hypothetical protein
MQYRAVIVRGTARLVDDPAEHVEALRLVSDHIVATWQSGRPPVPREVRKTMVVAVPLVETSAKIRVGDPADEPEDLAGPHWGGHVPLNATWGEPVPAADLPPGTACPDAVAALTGRVISPARGGGAARPNP